MISFTIYNMISQHPAPYLSIVVTSRNDNHGNNFLQRASLFIDGLITQISTYQIQTELIVVEWNPPENKPLLSEVLPTPPKTCPLSIRYLMIPSEIHERYANSQHIPLYQMIAKNTGIRRAKGEFILCTNMDLLFSDKLMEFIALKKLQAGFLYRADRCDVSSDILHLNLSFSEQLSWCENHILKRHTRNRLLLAILKWMISADSSVLSKGFLRKKIPLLYFLHLATDACGDFTLLHRNAWNNIQGYPELDLYSIHIDTLGIAAAYASGYQQVLLPSEACCYHIHHEDGWTSLDPIQKLKFTAKKPGLGLDVVIQASCSMIKHQTAHHLNPPNWGFSDETFNEITING